MYSISLIFKPGTYDDDYDRLGRRDFGDRRGH